MNNNTSPSIEVFLQPPSPTMNSCKLPSVKSLFPINDEHDQQNQQLPSIRLTRDHHSDDRNKLNIIEPTIDSSSLSTSPISPYQSSPIMTFSSPSSTTSSFCGSPLISPTQDGPFLLPPPDANSRRCRSVSNASQTSSPSTSPYCTPFSFRSLSEPPTLNLPPANDEEQESSAKQDDYHHPIFGPKRKRGRPPNATRPEAKSGSNWTFIKPTVWDVKKQQQQQQHQQQQQQQQQQQHHHHQQQQQHHVQHHPSSSPNSLQNTPQYLTETATVMADGINTFTSTNMDMALSIPKKKRGRKPKKQMAGNSCFVWRDLTAPRGANKKSLLSRNNAAATTTTTTTATAPSTTSNNKNDARTLLPAKKTDL